MNVDNPTTQEVYDAILYNNDRIVSQKVHLYDKAKAVAALDLDTTTMDFVCWMTGGAPPRKHVDQSTTTAMSRIGVLVSVQLQNSISSSIGRELSENYRVLVECSSMLHNWGIGPNHAGYSHVELRRIRSYSGTKVLKHLEGALTLTSLAQGSADTLKSLFLVLTGTIIAVGCIGTEGMLHQVRISRNRRELQIFDAP